MPISPHALTFDPSYVNSFSSPSSPPFSFTVLIIVACKAKPYSDMRNIQENSLQTRDRSTLSIRQESHTFIYPLIPPFCPFTILFSHPDIHTLVFYRSPQNTNSLSSKTLLTNYTSLLLGVPIPPTYGVLVYLFILIFFGNY